LKYVIYTVFLGLCSSITFTKKTPYPRQLRNKNHITTIIFDISGVLCKENTTALAKKIGLGTIAYYMATHWNHPSSVYLDMLETMSSEPKYQPSTCITYKKRIMPSSIVLWHQGHKTIHRVQADILDYIEQINDENYFNSPHEKQLATAITTCLFNPELMPDG